MSEPTVATACIECKVVDDHPKLHYGLDSYHNDCAPEEIVALLYGLGPEIVAACRSGIHGDELRAHIKSLHGEN